MALQSPDFRRRQDEIINARWQRRRDIPLAILAWIAVGFVALSALGYVTRTVIIMIIAGLLAFALAPAGEIFSTLYAAFSGDSDCLPGRIERHQFSGVYGG